MGAIASIFYKHRGVASISDLCLPPLGFSANDLRGFDGSGVPSAFLAAPSYRQPQPVGIEILDASQLHTVIEEGGGAYELNTTTTAQLSW